MPSFFEHQNVFFFFAFLLGSRAWCGQVYFQSKGGQFGVKEGERKKKSLRFQEGLCKPCGHRSAPKYGTHLTWQNYPLILDLIETLIRNHT